MQPPYNIANWIPCDHDKKRINLDQFVRNQSAFSSEDDTYPSDEGLSKVWRGGMFGI
jgi:hypothetical protein